MSTVGRLSPPARSWAFLVSVSACIALCGCPASSSNQQPVPDAPRPAPLQLGYCTTMEPHAKRIGSKVRGLGLRAFGSAAKALESLRAGASGIVLIGRLARASELPAPAAEVRLTSGHTLIRRVAGFIEYAALSQIRVHTAVDEDTAVKLLPEATEVVRHPSVEVAIREGLDEAVLISWDDFRDEHQLLIPMQAGAKVVEFRLPTLYHRRDLPQDQVQEIVQSFSSE